MPPNSDDEFDCVLGEILRRIDSGEAIDREAVCREFPQFREELEEYFRNDAWFDRQEVESVPLADPTESWIGAKIGKYTVSQVLGSGGMGIVCRAEDQELQRAVAIKLLASGPMASTEEVRRIRFEAEAVARLDHPSILPIFEVGQWQGQPYLVLPLLDGCDLQQRLKTGAWDAHAAARLIRDLASAISHAHARGVVHRDLKPANVLFSQDGRPMLADFGLAKANRKDSLKTASGQLLGTPNYMSPEQAMGRSDVGPLTDVYGLGGILYAVLTTHPPHEGASVAEIIRRVLEDEVVPPRSHQPNVPRDLQAICLTCLRREPEDRYASAEALANDLDKFLAGESTWASRSGPLSALYRPLRRDAHRPHFQSWGKTLLIFGVIILLAHSVMGSLRWQQFEPSIAYVIPRMIMFASLLGVLAWSRRGNVTPRTSIERPVWSIWMGYLASLMAANGLFWIWRLPASAVFPASAVLAGFGFIATGGQAWGGCYLLGFAFLIAAPLLTWMPYPEFGLGLLWFAALSVLARRYWF